ncbi:MAG: hypothetical protein M0R17_01835 [Candidatus Omnitrophica bacterium]|jgi:hypothetical protein|nr:hypothetical protein [Candidatus Omnitrophota bacterium]
MKEEELFSSWGAACKKLEMLKCFVQIPFDDMLRDGLVTKQDIKASLDEFITLYDEYQRSILRVYNGIVVLLNEKSKEI